MKLIAALLALFLLGCVLWGIQAGVSAIDRPGQPFHDPEADRALFAALEQNFRAGPHRKLLRLPLHINDEAFANALVAAWREISAHHQERAHATHR